MSGVRGSKQLGKTGEKAHGGQTVGTPLRGATFRVAPRVVWDNAPFPLRRSQQAVMDAEEAGIARAAFHAGTGAGKTHLLREMAARNAARPNPKKLLLTFPIHALVQQQASELGASYHDPASAFDHLVEMAKTDETWRKALASFEKDATLPQELRNSARVGSMVQGEMAQPVAMTPDSLFLLVRGLIASQPQVAGSVVDQKVLRRVVQEHIRKALEAVVLRGEVTLALAQQKRKTLLDTVEKVLRREGGDARDSDGENDATLRAAKLRKTIRRSLRPARLEHADMDRLVQALDKMRPAVDAGIGPKYQLNPATTAAVQKMLPNSVVVFDEYHLLARFPSFWRMLGWLRRFGAQVLLMSGTPRMDLLAGRDFRVVDFDDKEMGVVARPGESSVIFNQALEVTVQCETFTDSLAYPARLCREVRSRLQDWDANAPGPAVVILESVNRANVVMNYLNRQGLRGRVHLWTGPDKSAVLQSVLRKGKLPKDAIVIGTSAIELGVDLPFRNGIFEARFQDSLLQRIGRIGRMGSAAKGEQHHAVVLIHKKSLAANVLPGRAIERSELPELLAALTGLTPRMNDQDYEGLWLRGSSMSEFMVVFRREDGTYGIARGSHDLMKTYPPAHQFLDWSGMSPAKRRDAMAEVVGDKTLASRIAFADSLHRSVVAYVANAAAPVSGTIKVGEDEPMGNGRVLRQWTLGDRVLLKAIYPVRKGDGHPQQRKEGSLGLVGTTTGPARSSVRALAVKRGGAALVIE